ncbi:uncharacterized protein LOC18099670 isoform X4 [Populus trichocarpa]|uniref:uncharacterized protein LOC18099670 isoform X4 n=1 Tax=Populus trichocarpa TaxID=3694 RepID=UPI000D1896B3|nr:uncharacterized protein LOC18099670 isoform X4 [Populus trichocarpa]|eukprot:XP_024456749.1 uncharacterized protein LOC18099670 isoform X4 [Populus trichocarpa]
MTALIQVYDLETSYLQDPGQCGNVLKGFEGFLSSSKNTALLKRSRKFQSEDRLFSLSSVTSPAAEEQAAGRDGEPYKVAKLCFSVLFYQILSNLSVYCRWEIRIWSRSIQGWRHIRKRTRKAKEGKRCIERF